MGGKKEREAAEGRAVGELGEATESEVECQTLAKADTCQFNEQL